MRKPVGILYTEFLVCVPVIGYTDVGNAVVLHALTVHRNLQRMQTRKILTCLYFSLLTCLWVSGDNIVMVLSDEQIEEFRRLYKGRYGHDISREKAYEQGIKLIRLLERIYRKMTVEQYEAIEFRRIQTLPGMLAAFALQDEDNSVQ
jgi:aldehyde:ferredoxin oxidoreductase